MMLFRNLLCLTTQLVYMKLNKMYDLASCLFALLQLYLSIKINRKLSLCVYSLMQKREDILELEST